VISSVITLPDGRWLRWHEFGDLGGAPVIYTAGTPVSGYGGSDYQRKRTVVGWADDLAALARHLGLERFALAGESGGGPFTLAAAHQLAD